MTSDRMYVWVWLPDASQPVVCGLVQEHSGGRYSFTYGKSYRERHDAIPLYAMPLQQGFVPVPDGMTIHGALRDALPDAWGQNVIMSRLTGRSGKDADTGDLSLMTYMKESGSDRFGAIDFQASATDYVPRLDSATLDELVSAADALEQGQSLPDALSAAFTHGTSIGGARPKVTLTDGDDHWIAKLSSSSDPRPVVRHEALALELARRAAVDVAESRLIRSLGRDVLLMRRFDRGPHGTRQMAVSALTVLSLDEMFGRYATYPAFLDVLREKGLAPETVGDELFARIAANIALGNTDDHARNHTALWDGQHLRLSPAYDIDPCRTPGWDASQAMAYGRNGERASDLGGLVRTASVYGLGRQEALAVVNRTVDAIHDGWIDACAMARLTSAEAKGILGRIILNPAVLANLPSTRHL